MRNIGIILSEINKLWHTLNNCDTLTAIESPLSVYSARERESAFAVGSSTMERCCSIRRMVVNVSRKTFAFAISRSVVHVPQYSWLYEPWPEIAFHVSLVCRLGSIAVVLDIYYLERVLYGNEIKRPFVKIEKQISQKGSKNATISYTKDL